MYLCAIIKTVEIPVEKVDFFRFVISISFAEYALNELENVCKTLIDQLW